MPTNTAVVRDLWDTIEFNLRHEADAPAATCRARETERLHALRPGDKASKYQPPATSR